MEEAKVNCQNEGCANAVPPMSKKYCSRRCKHQVACRASRARLRAPKAKPKPKPVRALKRNYVRRVKATDMSTPRRDGKCHMCPKAANYGRKLYCSDECRVASARAKFAARKKPRELSSKQIKKLEKWAGGLKKGPKFAKKPTRAARAEAAAKLNW